MAGARAFNKEELSPRVVSGVNVTDVRRQAPLNPVVRPKVVATEPSLSLPLRAVAAGRLVEQAISRANLMADLSVGIRGAQLPLTFALERDNPHAVSA